VKVRSRPIPVRSSTTGSIHSVAAPGLAYTGTSSVTIVRTDAATLEVDHTFTNLSNGVVSVTGTADMTWSSASASRHIVHQLTWTRLADGRSWTGTGDRTQTLIDPTQGLAGGIRVDGNRTWTGASGTWNLAITGVEARLQDRSHRWLVRGGHVVLG
jgi:hypothetical protein